MKEGKTAEEVEMNSEMVRPHLLRQNYIKYERYEHTSEKAEMVGLDIKAGPNYTLPTKAAL